MSNVVRATKVINGTNGADLINGVLGNDAWDWDGLMGSSTAGNARPNWGDDTFVFHRGEANGGGDADKSFGGVGNHLIHGTLGNDAIDGGAGKDVLMGGSTGGNACIDWDDDTFVFHRGEADGDVELFGGAGRDVLMEGSTGGNARIDWGDDTFVFHRGEANGNAVVDFNGAGDPMMLYDYSPQARPTPVDSTDLTIVDGRVADTITLQPAHWLDTSDYLLG